MVESSQLAYKIRYLGFRINDTSQNALFYRLLLVAMPCFLLGQTVSRPQIHDIEQPRIPRHPTLSGRNPALSISSQTLNTHTINPVSALGVAASIISVVDLYYNIVKGLYDIYRSDSGTPQGHAHIGDMLENLEGAAKALTLDIESDSPHRESLQKLAGDCIAVSIELIKTLKEIQRKEGNKV